MRHLTVVTEVGLHQSARRPEEMAARADKCLSTMYALVPSLCDVQLRAEDGSSIFAHRIVLASSLQYFQCMFVGPVAPSIASPHQLAFAESAQPDILIRGIDGKALQQVVRWCYTTQIDISEENVQSLLSAAKMLDATEIVSLCCEFLRNQLQPDNALGIYEFAETLGCTDLQKAALAFVNRNFTCIVSQSDEFRRLSKNRLVEILSSDTLDTGENGEKAVLDALSHWLNCDPSSRMHLLPELVPHIRFPRMPHDVLVSIEDSHPFMRTSIVCKDLLLEAMRFHLSKGHIAAFGKENSRFKVRVPVGKPKVLLVVGGQAPKAIRQCEYYDFDNDTWFELKSELPSRRCRAGVVVLDGLVYAVGGFNGTQRIKTVDCYDPQTNRWSTVAPMDARRATLGADVLDRKIFAVGGFDGQIGLQSAEFFDPQKNCWQTIAAMSTRRSSVGVAALNGFLYAIGGYDGASRQCLSSVEFYNTFTDTWSKIPDMSQRRSGAGVGVLDNRLIVCGGHDGPAVRKSVECFDPNSNQWIQLSDMIVARRNAGVVSKGGYLYVIGGDDSQSNLASVEVYNPRMNCWTLLQQTMSIGRSYAGVCIVDKCF